MFPPVIDYETGLIEAGEPIFDNGGEYLLWIRDTYIQSTPFTYQDVREIHGELQDLRPDTYYYQWNALRNYLWEWRNEGKIIVLDGFDPNPGSHTLMWSSYYEEHRAKAQKRELEITKRFLQRAEEMLENRFDGG